MGPGLHLMVACAVREGTSHRTRQAPSRASRFCGPTLKRPINRLSYPDGAADRAARGGPEPQPCPDEASPQLGERLGG